MKKIILLLLISFLSYSQEQKDNGYFKVFQTTKSNSEVYQKAKEWTAITFKSAQNVIQLDKEEKIILKGNLPYTSFSYINNKISPTSFKGEFMMTVAIREGRYKVDVDFDGSTWAESYPQFKNEWSKLDFLWKNTSKEELLSKSLKQFDVEEKPYGISKKAWAKARQEMIDNFNNTYKAYLMTKESLDEQILLIFNSLSGYIDKETTEEDW